jgi:hypothetical protein
LISDWFKYSGHYNKDSRHGRLCSGNGENSTAASRTYYNRSNSSDNRADNKPFFIKPILEEKKARTGIHNDQVIDTLRKWSEIPISLTGNIGDIRLVVGNDTELN